MPDWKKGQRAAGHMVEQGLRVQTLKRRLVGLRTDDPRYVSLNDQLAAATWKWNRITVQALRHGMDAEYLGDKLDEHHARGPVADVGDLDAAWRRSAADYGDGMVDE